MITAACVVELTHLASLYHDDVMDEAALRRGAESANARWDNHVAILTGDFLFSKSSELTAELGADAVRIQAQTFTRLVEGQILETVKPGAGDDPLEHYLDVVAGKTGSLIATSARYGARFGGATPRGGGGAHGVRRHRRLGLPALRRHPRHRLRLRGVRQDARHRPARGRADAAGADGAARSTRPGGRPAAAAARRPTSATTACTPRRSACCGPTRRWTRPVPTSSPGPPRPRPCSSSLPEGPVRAALESFADLVATRST